MNQSLTSKTHLFGQFEKVSKYKQMCPKCKRVYTRGMVRCYHMQDLLKGVDGEG